MRETVVVVERMGETGGGAFNLVGFPAQPGFNCPRLQFPPGRLLVTALPIAYSKNTPGDYLNVFPTPW